MFVFVWLLVFLQIKSWGEFNVSQEYNRPRLCGTPRLKIKKLNCVWLIYVKHLIDDQNPYLNFCDTDIQLEQHLRIYREHLSYLWCAFYSHRENPTQFVIFCLRNVLWSTTVPLLWRFLWLVRLVWFEWNPLVYINIHAL